MGTDRRAMTVRVVSLHSHEAAQPPTPPQAAADRLLLVAELSARSWHREGRERAVRPRGMLRCVLRPLRVPDVAP